MRSTNKALQKLVILGLLLLLVSSCSDDDNPVITVDTGGPVQSVFLEFENNFLDLDSGLIDTTLRFITFDTTVDIWIALNSVRPIQSVLFQRLGREIAKLDGAIFSSVTVNQADSAIFQSALLDVPFDSTGTFLIKTEMGSVYKLGNPVENATGVTFDYALMSTTP